MLSVMGNTRIFSKFLPKMYSRRMLLSAHSVKIYCNNIHRKIESDGKDGINYSYAFFEIIST